MSNGANLGPVNGYLEAIAGSLAAIADRLEGIETQLKRYVDLQDVDPDLGPWPSELPPFPASPDVGGEGENSATMGEKGGDQP